MFRTRYQELIDDVEFPAQIEALEGRVSVAEARIEQIRELEARIALLEQMSLSYRIFSLMARIWNKVCGKA